MPKIFLNIHFLFFTCLTINFISLFTLRVNAEQKEFLNKTKYFSGSVRKELFIVDQKIDKKFPQIYSEDFLKLPPEEKIKEKSNYGKTDPFQLNQLDALNFNLSLIKLLGVYSAANEKYAIVSYNKKTGQITNGNIGGKDTNYLPNNFEIVDINIDKFSIIVKTNNKLYEIKG